MMVLIAPVMLALHPMVAELLSVTNEHTMAVEKSHACHNMLAAFLGSFFGLPEH
jgi:hypothetical protein